MSITPAGWYPDPRGTSTQRWWDGAQWTEHVSQPYALNQQQLVAPAGTQPYTAFIWLIVFLPLVSLGFLFTFDWGSYIDSTINPSTPFAAFTPQYFMLAGASWLITGVIWLLSFLDWRALKARGVPQPFHFAWVFLYYPVYIFGRSIVVKRRVGSGTAPMWAFIAVLAVSCIAVVVFMVNVVSLIMNLPNYQTY